MPQNDDAMLTMTVCVFFVFVFVWLGDYMCLHVGMFFF